MKEFKLFYILACLLITIPCYNCKKSRILKFYYIFNILVTCSIELNSVYRIYIKNEDEYEKQMGRTQIMAIGLGSALCWLQAITSTLRIACWNVRKWRKLFRMFSAFNLVLKKNQYLTYKTNYIVIFISTLFLIMGAFLNNIIWGNHTGFKQQLLKYCNFYIFMFIEHVRMCTSFLIIQIINKSFSFINKCIKQEINKNMKEVNIEYIRIFYRKLCKLIRLFNQVQGIHVFLGILQSSVMFLNYSNNVYAKLLWENKFPIILSISSTIVAASVMVSYKI